MIKCFVLLHILSYLLPYATFHHELHELSKKYFILNFKRSLELMEGTSTYEYGTCSFSIFLPHYQVMLEKNQG